MATDIAGLFGMTPESYQLAQDQAAQEQAAKYASMNPFERASYGMFRSGQQIGGAIGQALGAQDPELQRISQRQALLQGADITYPQVLLQKAAEALQQNDYAAASQLAQRALDVESKMATIAKDVAAANRERQQAVPADIQKAQRIAALKSAIPAYEASGDTTTATQLKTELDALTAAPATAQTELGKLLAERDSLDPIKDKAKIAAYNDKIKKLTTGGGLASEIAAGLSPVAAAIVAGTTKAAGSEIGKEVGKNFATIDGKFEANYAITDALDLLGKGIYAGGYAPIEETVAKYGMGILGDKRSEEHTSELH